MTERQKEAWRRLLGLKSDLVDIQAEIQDFAVEDAFDIIFEACSNYVSELNDKQEPFID